MQWSLPLVICKPSISTGCEQPTGATLSRLAPSFSVRTWEIQREKSHKKIRESNSPYSLTTSCCPLCAARCSGVQLYLSLPFIGSTVSRRCRVTLSRLAPDFSVRTWEIQQEKSHKKIEKVTLLTCTPRMSPDAAAWCSGCARQMLLRRLDRDGTRPPPSPSLLAYPLLASEP
eukprot:SAG31_NODE_4898_length_2878_cov_2.329975_3_plen_173_part_00